MPLSTIAGGANVSANTAKSSPHLPRHRGARPVIETLRRRFTPPSGVELAWDEWGEGEVPLVLVHGFSGCAHDFALQVEPQFDGNIIEGETQGQSNIGGVVSSRVSDALSRLSLRESSTNRRFPFGCPEPIHAPNPSRSDIAPPICFQRTGFFRPFPDSRSAGAVPKKRVPIGVPFQHVSSRPNVYRDIRCVSCLTSVWHETRTKSFS